MKKWPVAPRKSSHATRGEEVGRDFQARWRWARSPGCRCPSATAGPSGGWLNLERKLKPRMSTNEHEWARMIWGGAQKRFFICQMNTDGLGPPSLFMIFVRGFLAALRDTKARLTGRTLRKNPTTLAALQAAVFGVRCFPGHR